MDISAKRQRTKLLQNRGSFREQEGKMCATIILNNERLNAVLNDDWHTSITNDFVHTNF